MRAQPAGLWKRGRGGGLGGEHQGAAGRARLEMAAASRQFRAESAKYLAEKNEQMLRVKGNDDLEPLAIMQLLKEADCLDVLLIEANEIYAG